MRCCGACSGSWATDSSVTDAVKKGLQILQMVVLVVPVFAARHPRRVCLVRSRPRQRVFSLCDVLRRDRDAATGGSIAGGAGLGHGFVSATTHACIAEFGTRIATLRFCDNSLSAPEMRNCELHLRHPRNWPLARRQPAECEFRPASMCRSPIACGGSIDSARFRRLAQISQLGLVRLIYPAANHTRQEHSLGVFLAAIEYLDRLAADERFAAAVLPKMPNCCSPPPCCTTSATGRSAIRSRTWAFRRSPNHEELAAREITPAKWPTSCATIGVSIRPRLPTSSPAMSQRPPIASSTASCPVPSTSTKSTT